MTPAAVFIVGAGGIGCAVGHALRAAGIDVAFVEADHEKVRWGRERGVGVEGANPCRAEFLTFEEWQPTDSATVFLCTKCYDNARVLARLQADGVSPIRLIPIQNGFDPALQARASAGEGIASFVSECRPHRTHTRITRGGQLHFGVESGLVRNLATTGQAHGFAEEPSCLQALMGSRIFAQAGIRVEIVPDILPYKYAKLMYNAAISPLAAAAGLDNGQLVAVPKARRLFFELLRENHAILRAAGVALGKIGPFHPDTVERILRRPMLANALAWAFYPTLRRSYCSMSGDLPRGRTEIDYYNGHLLALARDFPCPLNRRVYQLVKRMERERILPGRRMLDELV